jgi:two-component system sensor histidine kinase/response regulator
MNDHLGKPIEPAQLWAALLRWIPARAASDEPEAVALALTPTPAADTPPLPAVVPGLDTRDGLSRLMGKREAYLSLLRMFVSGHRGAIVGIVEGLDRGDTASALRLAHSLRGAAGNIGAHEVQRLAGAVEDAIHDGQPRAEIDARVDVLRGPLGALVGALEGALRDPEPTAPTAVDPERLAATCEELGRLLAVDDARAGVCLRENAALLRAAFGAHFDALESALGSFTFDAALIALAEAQAARSGRDSP